MPLYSTLAALSQTAASNPPDGTVDAPSTIDDQLRLLGSFIAQLRDGSGFASSFGNVLAASPTGAQLVTARALLGVGDINFRNRAINGNMKEDQRNSGAAQTITAAAALAYCVDRFYAYCTGANVTGQQVTAADGTKRYQFTGAASVTAIGFGHRIEAANSVDLAGNTCTFSVKLANSLLTSVTWNAYYANTADTFGTLASPTRTSIASGTFTVSGTEAVYSAQLAVPSAATTGIEIVLSVGAQTSGTWSIGDFQPEKGAVPAAAISFERVDVATNKVRCQRYYEIAYATCAGISAAVGGQYTAPIAFKVNKRVVPTFGAAATIVSVNVSAATVDQIADYGARYVVTASTAAAFSGASTYPVSAEL